MLVGSMTLSSFTNPGRADKKKGQVEYKREVKVTTPIEFVEALQSDTRIHVMTNEPLNLTYALEKLAQDGKIKHFPGEGQAAYRS